MLARSDLIRELGWLDAHLRTVSDPKKSADIFDANSTRLMMCATGLDRDFLEQRLSELKARYAIPAPVRQPHRAAASDAPLTRQFPIG